MRAGKAIFRDAADDLKVLRLELGGKAPFIVAEDADIGAAVRAAVVSRFENCGQICICNERMYVHEKIADEFIERFITAVKALKVGDPHHTGRCRPEVLRRRTRTRSRRMVDRRRGAGAEVLTGGKRLTDGEFARGHWYEPTVLSVNDNAMADHAGRGLRPGRAGHARRPISTRALRLANESRYGLSAYVFTKDMRRMMRLIARAEIRRDLRQQAGRRRRPGPPCRHARQRHRRRGRQVRA